MQQNCTIYPFYLQQNEKESKRYFSPFLCNLFRCCLQKAHWTALDSDLCIIQGGVLLPLLKYHQTELFCACLQKINKFYKTKPGKRKQKLKVTLATYQTYQAFIIRLWEFWKSNGSLASVGCWKQTSRGKKKKPNWTSARQILFSAYKYGNFIVKPYLASFKLQKKTLIFWLKNIKSFLFFFFPKS